MMDKLRRILRPGDGDREKEDELDEQERAVALPLGDEGDNATTQNHDTTAGNAAALPNSSSAPPGLQVATAHDATLSVASLAPVIPSVDVQDPIAPQTLPQQDAVQADVAEPSSATIIPPSGQPESVPGTASVSLTTSELPRSVLAPAVHASPPVGPDGGDDRSLIGGSLSGDEVAEASPLQAREEAFSDDDALMVTPRRGHGGTGRPDPDRSLEDMPFDGQWRGINTESPTVLETSGSEVEQRPAASTPLPRGTVVGGRYTVISRAEPASEGATMNEVRYLATDNLAYQRCWSCGSTENTLGMRFCQSCGAGLMDHPIVLAWTAGPQGGRDEFTVPGGYVHLVAQRRRFGPEGIALQVGAYSAEGPHHPNEDSFWYALATICGNSRRESHGVIIFADGMGGYRPGSGLISRRAAEWTGETLWTSLAPYRRQNATLPNETEVERLVREAIAAGNNAVLDEIQQVGYDMGCTMIVTVLLGDTTYVANIGDSRAYYLSPDGAAEQITEDQSQVGALVSIGQMAPDAVYTAVGNNMILHAIGEEDVEAAAGWSVQPLEPASFLLLCSDGYWKTMRGIGDAVETIAQAPSLDEAARAMVNDALDHGSDDNTTVVVVRVD